MSFNAPGAGISDSSLPSLAGGEVEPGFEGGEPRSLTENRVIIIAGFFQEDLTD